MTGRHSDRQTDRDSNRETETQQQTVKDRESQRGREGKLVLNAKR